MPPLELPTSGQLAHPDQLARFPAVDLFVQRARAVSPDFQLTKSNATAVGEICMRLDGLPLAIELAAARINLFTPPALLRLLQRRHGATFQLLATGTVTRTTRQQTLHGAMEWSYQLLEPAEQELFRQLGVFIGGFMLATAEAIASESSIEHVVFESALPTAPLRRTHVTTLNLVTSLVDKACCDKRAPRMLSRVSVCLRPFAPMRSIGCRRARNAPPPTVAISCSFWHWLRRLNHRFRGPIKPRGSII